MTFTFPSCLMYNYLIFENEEVSSVGMIKKGGLKRVANGDIRKKSSLPVRSDSTAKEFGELKLISGDPVIEIMPCSRNCRGQYFGSI